MEGSLRQNDRDADCPSRAAGLQFQSVASPSGAQADAALPEEDRQTRLLLLLLRARLIT